MRPDDSAIFVLRPRKIDLVPCNTLWKPDASIVLVSFSDDSDSSSASPLSGIVPGDRAGISGFNRSGGGGGGGIKLPGSVRRFLCFTSATNCDIRWYPLNVSKWR